MKHSGRAGWGPWYRGDIPWSIGDHGIIGPRGPRGPGGPRGPRGRVRDLLEGWPPPPGEGEVGGDGPGEAELEGAPLQAAGTQGPPHRPPGKVPQGRRLAPRGDVKW